MIKDQIYCHNVTELEPAPGGSVYLRRYPRDIRMSLSDRGRLMSEEATGCELRFVTEAKHIKLTLSLPESDGVIRVYKGGMLHSEHLMQAGSLRTLHLEEPAARLAMVDRKHLLQAGFAPEVWRICFGRATAQFWGLNTFGYRTRPPEPEEMPHLRWLAYGSSITHGLDNSQLSYVQQAARRQRLDVMNLGLGGSCLCEPQIADWIAGRTDWDIASFELGVNMRDLFSEETFGERVGYLLERIIQSHPDKPLFLMTIYPNFATYADNDTTRKDARFNDILREHTARLNHPLLYLLEGSSIMEDMSGMTCDLIHPGEYGHIRMGESLADAMSRKLYYN